MLYSPSGGTQTSNWNIYKTKHIINVFWVSRSSEPGSSFGSVENVSHDYLVYQKRKKYKKLRQNHGSYSVDNSHSFR